MKRFLVSAMTAAALAAMAPAAFAVVDLDLDTGSVAYANELVTNNQAVTGVTTTNKLGFGVSAGQTRYVRYDFTNAAFTLLINGTALTLNPNPPSDVVVSQGGAAGNTWVIFQITAGAVGNAQTDAVEFDPGDLTITNKLSSASVKYSLYETAAQAAAGGTAGLLATADGAVATFPSGLTFAAVPNSTTAEVTTLYTEFNNGVTTTLAKIGTVTYAPNEAVHNPADGAALTAADMPLFTAAGTKLVLTGDDLSAAATDGVYLAAAGTACDAGPGTLGTNLTATTADFVIDAVAVGTSPVPPGPNTGRDVCFQATGDKPIAAQSFTVAATVVAKAGTTTANQAAIPAGAFKRNGTILKAAFSDSTSASGVTMAVHLINTSGLPAPYTVRCLLNDGSAAGTSGTVPANQGQRISVVNGLGCTGDGTLRGVELTFAVPEGNVMGSMVRQNVSTGQAAFDSMLGSK